jgi:hypothetical protein
MKLQHDQLSDLMQRVSIKIKYSPCYFEEGAKLSAIQNFNKSWFNSASVNASLRVSSSYIWRVKTNLPNRQLRDALDLVPTVETRYSIGLWHKKRPEEFRVVFLWCGAGSNRRHKDFQSLK